MHRMTAQPPYPGVSDDDLLARLKYPSSNVMPCTQIISNMSFVGTALDTVFENLWYKV